MAGEGLNENAFFGGWHPNEQINLEYSSYPFDAIQPRIIQSKNWFLISTISNIHPHKPGLIHAGQKSLRNKVNAVAFRGYILDPPIHSYSSTAEIINYWQKGLFCEHNGVFSAVCVRDDGRTLELINDAFGMAPLYYRKCDKLILFATNPRFLRVANDEPDYMAWRYLIQTGFIVADRTLTNAIKRVPAGQMLRYTNEKDQGESFVWFDYSTLPEGVKRIDSKAIAKVEESFQKAISRCLKLEFDHIFLPLSSGYDSRRILASLIDKKITFESATVKTFQKQYRDLDARFASAMAKELGFSHRVIEAGDIDEYVLYDCQRRILLDTESYNHSWALSLIYSLPKHPTMFIDGLAGDALGETGFDKISGLHIEPGNDKFIIATNKINSHFDGILHSRKWPSASDLRHEMIKYIATLGSGMNQAELAFLLLQTRRSIAIWAQQMLPAGHIVVCPYLDLEYVKTLLSYHPAAKLTESFQTLCLRQYWPRYFSYPGTRAIPPHMPPGSPFFENAKKIACFQELLREIKKNDSASLFKSLLTTKSNFYFWIIKNNIHLTLRRLWAYNGIMELVASEVQKVACWEILQKK